MEFINETPVAALILIFTVVTSLYAFNDAGLYGKFMLHPYSVYRKSKVYTLITSGLIHADYMHLFFNMFTFYMVGFQLERMVGHWQFALIYFASLIFSDIPSVLKHKNDFWYNSLGASGAISGVLFSFILFKPLSKFYIMFIPIGIPAVIFGALYLIYCAYASKNSRDNINHDAHFFGALTGIIITILIVPGIVPHFLQMLLGAGQ
ncbi:rhomboid family intramembrane serine protease [Pedobacter duraquae]|uniref:Rhomboid family protein n=1 Tax=Pedobacter duraquae TaxID=425511 RepID=A0A4R6IGX7_9SPHI|nr:rhomboid family intramembrane serine protease [Pedobacter duraquae]TDO21374.1 rhomboid family protein [Pedobacter duraquae]